MFTATTATCVTGLVTVTTATAWSVFGQAVILILIQIGGLGVITVMSGITLAVHKRFRLKDSILLQDAFNLNSLSGLGSFLKKAVLGTLIVESVGALLYMTVFVPEFGARGIWISVFNSVSAFCNAGIDIISDTSLCAYATNPVINVVTSLLIVLGGLGFIVWWDLIEVFKRSKNEGMRAFSRLTLHSKIVLVTTMILIFGGGLLILLLEYNNPMTVGNMSLFDKIQVSLFQSVTTRTAGFASVMQDCLRDSTSVISLALMFIGGSPVGTAGGIKTVTVAVLFATALSSVANKDDVSLLGRRIPRNACNKAVTVVIMSFSIVFVSTIALSVATNVPLLDVLYETVSATATVGLSRGITSTLNAVGKIIIILTMYLGRVGPISLAFAFKTRTVNTNNIKNPVEEVTVG